MNPYAIIKKSGRIAIIDNSTNIIILLSPSESRGFDGCYHYLDSLRNSGFPEFYQDKVQELCHMYVGAA